MTELAENGDLLSLLRKRRLSSSGSSSDLEVRGHEAAGEGQGHMTSTRELVGFALQVAKGMEFLTFKRVCLSLNPLMLKSYFRNCRLGL